MNNIKEYLHTKNIKLLYIYLLSKKEKYTVAKTIKTRKGYRIRLQHPTLDFTTDLIISKMKPKDS